MSQREEGLLKILFYQWEDMLQHSEANLKSGVHKGQAVIDQRYPVSCSSWKVESPELSTFVYCHDQCSWSLQGVKGECFFSHVDL